MIKRLNEDLRELHSFLINPEESERDGRQLDHFTLLHEIKREVKNLSEQVCIVTYKMMCG